jgi:3-deoxy-D-manno-octulosonic-acid transferase
MFRGIKFKNIPLILLNARITKRTFQKWNIISRFAKEMFSKIDFCFTANKETRNYLAKLGSKKIKFIGNLKYSQLENEKLLIDQRVKNFIASKKSWCASSTHNSEEKFCGIIHKELKKKYKNILTIIIPRHINRVNEIKSELEESDLKVHLHEPIRKINKDIDIYLVNTYGQTKSFFNECKNIFLGGSLIKHGGQNPLEAARYGCNILHGPNVSNFREIYEYLNKIKISKKIDNKKNMIQSLNKIFMMNKNSRKTQEKLKIIGKKILNSTYKEVNLIINQHEV